MNNKLWHFELKHEFYEDGVLSEAVVRAMGPMTAWGILMKACESPYMGNLLGRECYDVTELVADGYPLVITSQVVGN